MTMRNTHALLLPLLVLVGVFVGTARPAHAQATDLGIHDPSTLVKSDKSTYWVFGTGRGIASFSSTDRVHWTFRGEVIAQAPPWVKEVVPGNTNNFLWAPDVIRVGDRYLLY